MERREEISEMAEKRLFRIGEVCEALALSRAEVYRRQQAGELRFTRIGKAVRVAAEDLDAFVADRRRETQAV
jgi:excisionase family DNA binding protein